MKELLLRKEQRLYNIKSKATLHNFYRFTHLKKK